MGFWNHQGGLPSSDAPSRSAGRSPVGGAALLDTARMHVPPYADPRTSGPAPLYPGWLRYERCHPSENVAIIVSQCHLLIREPQSQAVLKRQPHHLLLLKKL